MTRKEVHGAAAIEVFNRAIKKCFYPVITDKPFGLNKPKISWVANGEPIPAGFRMPLTPDEIDTLRKAVPELTDARLEAFLRLMFRLGDERAAAMTWKQIVEFCKESIRQEKQNTPAETDWESPEMIECSVAVNMADGVVDIDPKGMKRLAEKEGLRYISKGRRGKVHVQDWLAFLERKQDIGKIDLLNPKMQNVIELVQAELEAKEKRERELKKYT